MANKEFFIKDYGDFEIVKNFIEFYADCKETGEIVDTIIFSCFFAKFGEIDILLLSYIILYQKDFPNTKFHFTFSENQTESGFKVIHQLTHSNITCGLNKFEVDVNYRKKNGVIVTNKFKDTNIKPASPNFIESMIPPLFIDLYSTEKLFKAYYINDLWASIKHEKLNKDEIDICSKNPIDFYKKRNKISDIDAIAKVYLLKTLQQLGVLRKNLFDDDDYQIGRYIGVGDKNRKDAINFRTKVNHTLREDGFYDFNMLELFFFSMLIQKCLKLPDISTNKSGERSLLIAKIIDEKYLPTLKHLIVFVKDLSLGIYELARNIVEHSSDKRGVITGRIYKQQIIKELKKGRINDYLEYNKHNNYEFFLDINVVDVGNTELKSNYIKNLESTIESLKGDLNNGVESTNTILGDMLAKDIETIKQSDFYFSDLLNYERFKLENQTRKVLARLGLLIFTNQIINKHNGFIKVASGNFLDGKINGAFLYKKDGELNTYEGDIIDYLPLGTNYNFIIPISLSMGIDKYDYVSNDNPKGSALSVFKELFSYQVIESDVQEIDKKKIPIFLNPFNLQAERLGKYDKLFSLKKDIINRTRNIENKIIAIDAAKLNSIMENSSDWVRFIANLQMTENPLDNVIIFNISEDIHNEIIDINTLFDHTHFGFWSDNQYVLFFVKIQHLIDDYNLSLWFNDVLSQKSYKNYLNLNRTISHYHYNLYSITESSIDIEETIEGIGPMFSNGKLLNFELLLKTKDGYSLYEESVMSMLNLEIKTL